MFLRLFGLYSSACFRSLFVSILCTCCSHFFWFCFIQIQSKSSHSTAAISNFLLLAETLENKFYVQGSVHREYIFKYNQQDATLHNSFISAKCSTCFRRFLRLSSGAQKL
jgi:hypothetical protein